MPVTDSTVAKFWAWFVANAAVLRAVPAAELQTEKLYQQLADQLAKCHKRLKPEIDTAKGEEDWTLVITPDGEERLFGFVETITAAAPAVPGWKVRAFRSRAKIAGSRITFGPHKLGTEDIFATVQAADTGRVTVTLFVRGLAETPGLGRAAEILYQHAIGEYDAVKVVSKMETVPLPDPPPAEAVSLAELPTELDQRIGRG